MAHMCPPDGPNGYFRQSSTCLEPATKLRCALEVGGVVDHSWSQSSHALDPIVVSIFFSIIPV